MNACNTAFAQTHVRSDIVRALACNERMRMLSPANELRSKNSNSMSYVLACARHAYICVAQVLVRQAGLFKASRDNNTESDVTMHTCHYRFS